MSFLKRRPSAANVPASTPGYSVLDAQLVVVGDIETEGTLRIDGRLRGSIRRADLVIIGAGANVEGDVAAREVIVGGTVTGDIAASERAELQASAVVTGDIATAAVLIHEGGALRGRLLVRAAGAAEERTTEERGQGERGQGERGPSERQQRAMRPTPRGVRLVAGADTSA